MTALHDLVTLIAGYNLYAYLYADFALMQVLHATVALRDLATAFASWNLHACVYAAFGLTLTLQAFGALRERKYDKAREYGAHGMIYLILGLS